MFPLYDSIKAEKFPIINILLILATIGVFLLEITTPDPDGFIQKYALIPSMVSFSNLQSLKTFITSIFLHAGWLHILSNLWFLWIFGDNVEAYVGRLKYFALYIVAGVIGNLVQYLIAPHSSISILGASGAIAGVLGAYFVLFPYAKVKTLIFIFFFVTLIDISAPIILAYWFILQVISGVTSLPLMANSGGVAFFAHVGGFIAGMILARLFTAQPSSGQILEGEVVT